MLIAGKISQAAVFSAAAYRDEETFRRTTGIAKCKLIVDKDERNTHVSMDHLELDSMPARAYGSAHEGCRHAIMPAGIMSAVACARHL